MPHPFGLAADAAGTRSTAAARQIVVAVVGAEARVAGDADQLVTALANLLENAITTWSSAPSVLAK